MSWRERADRMNQAVLRNFGESEPVIYVPAETGIPFGVVAFFESTAFEINLETQVSRNVYRPRAFLRLEDLGRTPAEDDRMLILGEEYLVTAEEFDGFGGVYLYLARLS